MNLKKDPRNRHLMKHGFGKLDDPNLIHQLAYMVKDHDHFRSVLTTVEPDKRYECYTAMTPHLRFKAKALDVYIMEAAQLAGLRESNQSPLDVLASEAIQRNEQEAKIKGSLHLECSRCTTEAYFPAKNHAEATKEAAKVGWGKAMDRKDKTVLTFCPKCAKFRILIVQ